MSSEEHVGVHQDGVERSERTVIELEPGRRVSDDADAIDVVVREVKSGPQRDSEEGDMEAVGYYAGELIATLTIQTMKSSFMIGRALVQRATDTRAGRLVTRIANGAAEAVATDIAPDLEDAGRVAEEQLGRVVSVVVPVVVQAVDTQELLDQLDINAFLEAVDIDRLLDRVDIDGVLERVDLAQIMGRIDVDSLLARIDIDALMARVDMEALLDRVDLDALLETVDMDAVLDRVDVAGLAKRAKVGELVAESTTDVAGSVLDLGRRQAVGIDTLIAGVVRRVLGRPADSMPLGPAALLGDTPKAEAPDADAPEAAE